MITPRIADYLALWRPFSIEITLYGRTRATYERLTGVPGSYEKCLRGIDLLLERRLPLALKSVAVTVNVHELQDMQKFAEDLGVEFKFDSMMNPRIDCSQSPLAVRLSPEDCVALDLEDPRRMDAWKDFAKDNLGPANPPERADEVYHCGGGVTSFAISIPRWTQHLRVVAAGQVRPAERIAARRLERRAARRAAAEDHGADQVHDVRTEVDVRDVPGQRRARER